ncbi:hypothetical protein [Streptomyces sp. NPDC086010]|uniref:hypothetical protein n=1 Tax=Streptomyces sp. NPDC086010 TaxID=3365745 RepID=UPI0037D39769
MTADSGGAGGAGWAGIATEPGAGAAVGSFAAPAFVRRRRGAGTHTTRGSA